jgi:hypothetical protein
VTLDGNLSAQMPELLDGVAEAFQRAGSQWRLRLPGVSGGVYRLSG